MIRTFGVCVIAAALTWPVLARAQEATPAALPTVLAAADCTGEPVTLADIEAVLAVATPAPRADVGSENELPRGEPANPATVATITAGEYAFAACYNAGD